MKLMNLYYKYNKFNASINEWKNSIYEYDKYKLNIFIKQNILNNINIKH